MKGKIKGTSFNLDPGDNDTIISTPAQDAAFSGVITGVCPDVPGDAIVKHKGEMLFHAEGLDGDEPFTRSFRNDLIEVDIFFEGHIMSLY